MVDDIVCCVLEETFTRAERTLIERGERESIQRIRRQFQEAVREEFIGVVEQATGRKVRAFLSDTDVANDISVETFLLADDRTSMVNFEEDANRSDWGTADPRARRQVPRTGRARRPGSWYGDRSGQRVQRPGARPTSARPPSS